MGLFRLLLVPLACFLRAGCAGAESHCADQPGGAGPCLYKLALVMLAAILGMFFDVAVFLSPLDSYLDDDWKRAPEPCGFEPPFRHRQGRACTFVMWPPAAAFRHDARLHRGCRGL